jgi:hypothetical protein
MDEIELVWDRVRKTPAFQAGPQNAQVNGLDNAHAGHGGVHPRLWRL